LQANCDGSPADGGTALQKHHIPLPAAITLEHWAAKIGNPSAWGLLKNPICGCVRSWLRLAAIVTWHVSICLSRAAGHTNPPTRIRRTCRNHVLQLFQQAPCGGILAHIAPRIFPTRSMVNHIRSPLIWRSVFWKDVGL